MWLGVWKSRRRGEKKYADFITRYYEYRKTDCVRICGDHHAEIHVLYDEIIADDRVKTGLNLSDYSWVQAERLMDKLEAACDRWLKKQTPGFSSKSYHKTKTTRRKKELINALIRKSRQKP